MRKTVFRVVAYAINPDTGRSVDGNLPAGKAGAIPSLTFVGFFGMNDALRSEVKEAMQRVRAADMRVVMITGDHRLTAQAIAKEADIWREGDNVLTGEEIDKMSEEELAEKLASTTAFCTSYAGAQASHYSSLSQTRRNRSNDWRRR